MKIWEIRLQNGIFVYKAGISLYISPLTTIVHYICIDLAIF